jgi:Asp-tRNA(Asn)/Glu-tRNA(Gln) amidotransferase B subunit
MGEVMQETRGKAKPELARELLQEKLEQGDE